MSNFRQFRDQKRKELENKNNTLIQYGNTDANEMGQISLLSHIKASKKSGQLNLSLKNLKAIPEDVYHINDVEVKEKATISFDNSGDDGWWDDVMLSKLILTSNSIKVVESKIILLHKLTVLDLYDNEIKELPNELCELKELSVLNVGKNQLIALPDRLCELRQLQTLKITENKLSSFPNYLDQLKELETLDASNNQFSVLPRELCNLSNLQTLNFSKNKITEMPFNFDNLRKLKVLDLSYNKIKYFSEKFSSQVTFLNLQVNLLEKFPVNQPNPNLVDLYLSHNHLKDITYSDHLCNCPNLKSLTLSHNKIRELSSEINKLTSLYSLDISSNELTNLPLQLGHMSCLNLLSINGNAFRTIKRSIVEAGADAIKAYLLSRDQSAEPDKALTSSNNTPSSCTSGIGCKLDVKELKRNGCARLENVDNESLVLQLLDMLLEYKPIKVINLAKNKLELIPTNVWNFSESLVELNLSCNQFNLITSDISKFKVLQHLDLSRNKLNNQSLPPSLGQMDKLAYLNVSYNCFQDVIPSVIYLIPNLRQLIVSHSNIKIIDAVQLKNIEKLDTLDFSNNEISSVPPELGLCEQIKNLNLEGNGFRVPRLTVLSRGTAHTLEYLRSRIVE